jgi:hypothetical protein
LDGNTLGVDSSQVGIFEKRDKVCLSSFLKSHDGRRLEAEISLHEEKRVRTMESESEQVITYFEVLSNFTDKSLEGEFANEQLGRLLVTTNFTESHSSGPEAMGLLHTTSGGLIIVDEYNVDEDATKKHIRRSYELRTWQRVVYEGLCHRWTCEQFAWYGPLEVIGGCWWWC